MMHTDHPTATSSRDLTLIKATPLGHANSATQQAPAAQANAATAPTWRWLGMSQLAKAAATATNARVTAERYFLTVAPLAK